MIIHKDFHGYKLTEAIRDIDLIVGETRIGRKTAEAQFVTGRGIIRSAILDRLKNTYGIEAHHQIGNDGVIIATIE